MNTVNSFIHIAGSKSLLFLLFIAVTISLGCRQAEEQPEDAGTDTTSEEVASQEQEETKETTEESSEMTDTDTEADEESADTGETETKTETDAKETGDDKVIAIVNGNPIYEKELRGNKTLDDLIMNEIFYLEGLDRGLDEKFEKQVNDYKKRIITSAVHKQMINKISDPEVTEEEMKEYYENNKSKYTHLTVKQLSVEDEDSAKEIRTKLLDGKTAEDITEEYEDGDTAVTVRETRLPTNLNDRFDKLESGSVSEVVKGQRGYDVMVITQVQSIPFEKAKPAIRHNVIGTKRGEAMQREADKIKEKLGIEVEIKE